MQKNLDKFIIAIRDGEKPFKYEEPHDTGYFMLSYDESIRELDGEDFRAYIIAALHVKGAKDIKSYVKSTMIFSAQIKATKSTAAIANWKKYFTDIFGKEPSFVFVLCSIKMTDKDEPVYDKVPDSTLEASFDTKLALVKDKFEKLKK